MKSLFRSAGLLTAVFVTATLTGCAAMEEMHQRHHPESASSQAPGPMTSGSSGAQMGMGNMQAMCDMYKKMMSARTPEEQQAMMDQYMKGMSPEMRQQHMGMMQQQCKS